MATDDTDPQHSPFDRLPSEILELVAYAVCRTDLRDLIAFRHVCGRFFRCVEGMLRRHFRRGLKLEGFFVTGKLIYVKPDVANIVRLPLLPPQRTESGDFVFDVNFPAESHSTRAHFIVAERELGLARSFQPENLGGLSRDHRHTFKLDIDKDSKYWRRRRIDFKWTFGRIKDSRTGVTPFGTRLVLRGAEGYCDLLAGLTRLESRFGNRDISFAELFYLRLGVFADHTRVFDALTRTLYSGQKARALLHNRSAWLKVAEGNSEGDVLDAIAAIEEHTAGAMLEREATVEAASEVAHGIHSNALSAAISYMYDRAQGVLTTALRAMCRGHRASEIPAMLARQYPLDEETKVAAFQVLLRRAICATQWKDTQRDIEEALAMCAHMCGDDTVNPADYKRGARGCSGRVMVDADDMAVSDVSDGYEMEDDGDDEDEDEVDDDDDEEEEDDDDEDDEDDDDEDDEDDDDDEDDEDDEEEDDDEEDDDEEEDDDFW